MLIDKEVARLSSEDEETGTLGKTLGYWDR